MGMTIEMLDARVLMSDSAFFRTGPELGIGYADVVEARSGYMR